MKNVNKELVSLVFIIGSGLLILTFVGILFIGLKRFLALEQSGWYLLLYGLLCLSAYAMHRFTDSSIVRGIYKVLVYPFRFMYDFLILSAPYLILQVHFLMYLLFSALLPLAFLLLDVYTELFYLHTPTHIYIIVTLSVITATLLNRQMKALTYRFTPLRLYPPQALKRQEFMKLTDYLLSENNIKFIIYLIYFLYLLIVNLFNFEQNSFYSSPEVDKAVLQSFITFIALERLIANLKDLEFKPSEMVRKLLNTMTGKEPPLPPFKKGEDGALKKHSGDAFSERASRRGGL